MQSSCHLGVSDLGILPLGEGMPARRSRDYRRNGTTTLYTTLDTLIRKVIEHYRHEEFIDFSEHVDRSVLRKLDLHLIVKNYATHSRAKVKDWFGAHPHYNIFLTLTSPSWLNVVERSFPRLPVVEFDAVTLETLEP